MLKKNEIYRTAVSGFTSEGLGVCRVDGCAVFVPNAAPDEEYDLRITHVGRHAAYGRIERILTASPDRCTRLCPDAKRCGGCDFWHLRYPAECRIKAQRVTDALNRIGGQNLPLVALTPAPTCESYRNKAQFPVAMGKTGIEAGFFEKGTHNVVPVEHCRIQPACAEQARSAVLRYARRWSVPAYDETARTGLLRHIYVRHAEATEQVLVCLVVNGERLPHEDDLVDTLRKAVPGLRSVVLNTNTRSGNAVLGETMRTLWGGDAIEDILCGLRFRISPRSFYQVNRTQAERLYGKALAAAGLTGGRSIGGTLCYLPQETVSRAEFLVMAMELLDVPVDDTLQVSGFADADDAPAWLQPYLASAMRRGIVNGMVSERGLVFRPNEPVTAGQAAVMLQNMLELPVSAAVSQTDAPYWAASSMQALQEAGIPLAAADTSVSRIEAARMLYRVSRLPK